MTAPRLACATALCTVAFVLAGCTLDDASGTQQGNIVAGTGGAVTTMSPEEREPLGPVNPSPKTTLPTAPARLAVTDMDVKSHGDFDRVTITLSGDGEPGWFADYVSSPVEGSTGQPLKVKGSAFLNVSIDGTVFPSDVGAETSAPERVSGGAGTSGTVAEVVNAGTSAGRTQVVVGLNSRSPYGVVTLHNPTRIIIDATR